MKRQMKRQEIINELYKLYRLKEEGKKVDILIQELEAKLYETSDDDLDAKEDDEED